MKRVEALVPLPVLILLVTAVNSLAQQDTGIMWRGSGRWGPDSSYNRLYDSKILETINGEVTSVERFTPGKGMSMGVHMNVKTDKETVSVHLGPTWYVENQDVKIEPQDKVEVKGSRISFEGKPAIMAAEVRKGDEVLRLRDDAGSPVWIGWRRR